MSNDNPSPAKLNEFLVDFTKFVVEKIENVESPSDLELTDFELNQLINEFKQKNGTSNTVENLISRLQTFRTKLPEIKNIDGDLKVKMLFGFNVPIELNLLNALKKEADVEVDDQNRIIKYQKNRGILKSRVENVRSILRSDIPSISQSVLAPQFSETEQKLLEILSAKSQNKSSPMTNKSFIEEFKALTGILKSDGYLKNRYNFVKDQIHMCTEFDKKTKIKMIFVSSAKVNGDFLKELQKDAVVEVDGQQRVKKYKANDGSLELTGDHSQSAKTKKGIAEWKSRSQILKSSIEDEDEPTERIENERDDDKVEFSESSSPSTLKRKIIKNSPACSTFSKIIKRGKDSDVQNVPKETSYQAAENSVGKISRKSFLKALRNLVYALETPLLGEFQDKIKVAIENLGDHDHNVPVDNVLSGLYTSLNILKKSAVLAPRQVDSTCFSKFLLILRFNLYSLDSPALNRFQENIKEVMREYDAHNENVPIQSIRLFLETLFLLITC